MKKNSQNRNKPDADKRENDPLQNEEALNPNNKRERLHVDMEDLSTTRTTPDELKEESTFPDAKLKESNLTKEDFEALGPKPSGAESKDEERPWPVDFEAREGEAPVGNAGKNDNEDPGR